MDEKELVSWEQVERDREREIKAEIERRYAAARAQRYAKGPDGAAPQAQFYAQQQTEARRRKEEEEVHQHEIARRLCEENVRKYLADKAFPTGLAPKAPGHAGQGKTMTLQNYNERILQPLVAKLDAQRRGKSILSQALARLSHISAPPSRPLTEREKRKAEDASRGLRPLSAPPEPPRRVPPPMPATAFARVWSGPSFNGLV